MRSTSGIFRSVDIISRASSRVPFRFTPVALQNNLWSRKSTMMNLGRHFSTLNGNIATAAYSNAPAPLFPAETNESRVNIISFYFAQKINHKAFLSECFLGHPTRLMAKEGFVSLPVTDVQNGSLVSQHRYVCILEYGSVVFFNCDETQIAVSHLVCHHHLPQSREIVL